MSCAALPRGAEKKKRCLLHGDGRHRTAVYRLLAIAGIARSGIGDPRLIVPQLKNLRAKLGTESAADAKIHINFRSSHDSSFLVVYFLSSQ
jgi:hypothetical protein